MSTFPTSRRNLTLYSSMGCLFVSDFIRGVDVKLEYNAAAIAIGLIVMIWPVLTKVQFEALPKLFRIRKAPKKANVQDDTSPTTAKIYTHLGLSFILNWLVAPFVMLALAHICLPSPKHSSFRIGLILVGLARCIAMVLVWNRLAGGDEEYCAILVLVNSLLQLALYPVYSLLFVGVIEGDSRAKGGSISYGKVAISVLIVSGFGLQVSGYLTWYLLNSI